MRRGAGCDAGVAPVVVVGAHGFGKDGVAPKRSLFLRATAGSRGKHSKAPKCGSGVWDMRPG